MRHLTALLALSLSACGATVSGSESTRVGVSGERVGPLDNLTLSAPVDLSGPGDYLVSLSASGTIDNLEQQDGAVVLNVIGGESQLVEFKATNSNGLWSVSDTLVVHVAEESTTLALKNASYVTLTVDSDSVLTVTKL